MYYTNTASRETVQHLPKNIDRHSTNGGNLHILMSALREWHINRWRKIARKPFTGHLPKTVHNVRHKSIYTAASVHRKSGASIVHRPKAGKGLNKASGIEWGDNEWIKKKIKFFWLTALVNSVIFFFFFFWYSPAFHRNKEAGENGR